MSACPGRRDFDRGVGALTAAAAALLPSLFKSAAPEDEDGEAKDKWADKEEINWLQLVKDDLGKPDLLEIRKFCEDFEKMPAETGVRSLVILIDDLDRCLPERIIETLKAIKLFVAVPKTTFVIDADPHIVRHAIATRYVKQQIGEERPAAGRDEGSPEEERYDLIQDYLKKLIQIPYHLPRLSPAEIETYINLLACQKNLGAEQCKLVLDHFDGVRPSLVSLHGLKRPAAPSHPSRLIT